MTCPISIGGRLTTEWGENVNISDEFSIFEDWSGIGFYDEITIYDAADASENGILIVEPLALSDELDTAIDVEECLEVDALLFEPAGLLPEMVGFSRYGVMPELSASGVVWHGMRVRGIAEMPAPSASGVVRQRVVVVGAAQMPEMVAQGVIRMPIRVTGTATIPSPIGIQRVAAATGFCFVVNRETLGVYEYRIPAIDVAVVGGAVQFLTADEVLVFDETSLANGPLIQTGKISLPTREIFTVQGFTLNAKGNAISLELNAEFEGQEEIQEYEVTDAFAFGDIQRTYTEITASDIESESWMVTLRANTMNVTGLWLLIGRKQNWRRGS